MDKFSDFEGWTFVQLEVFPLVHDVPTANQKQNRFVQKLYTAQILQLVPKIAIWR